jgi:ubiquinone/menaquinone biosynthesis C-methylase UbiE
MASIRIKRMQNGETDTMIKLSSAAPGDSIIDCTAGLASDSIVFAHAAGERGNVVALESELVLHYLVKNGLAEYNTQNEQLAEAMRRVRLELADHGRYLRECPDNSADVVYFDPMFRKPIHESSAIGSIRSLANGGRIEEDTIRHAVRVARKTVLLKEHRDSGEFARLGFTTVHRTSTKIAYGVITI